MSDFANWLFGSWDGLTLYYLAVLGLFFWAYRYGQKNDD